MFDLYSVMRDHGFHIIGEINYYTDKVQRFKNAKYPNKGKDIYLYVRGDQGATFGDWHDKDNPITWWANGRRRLSIKEQIERDNIQREIDRKKTAMRELAIRRSYNLWSQFYLTEDCDDHPYVVRKRIRSYYARQIRQFRFIKSHLIIPIRNVNYEFRGVQIIKADGFKRLWKGTSQKENMIWLSEPLPKDYKGMIRICEGYSTGCSIYEAIGSPVICAINAYNLVCVSQSLKKHFPLATLIICADNDAWSRDNPGIKYAVEAMKLTGAIMRRPSFTGFDVSERPTDFNDLLCLGGIEIVENQLLKQYK